MCGRFFVPDAAIDNAVRGLPDDVAEKLRQAIKEWVEDMNRPRYDIRPTHSYPVATMTSVEPMRWGYITEKSNSVFNARMESLGWGLWRESLVLRRGLIVSGGFYEWTGEKGAKQAHAVRRADGNPMLMGVLYAFNYDPRLEQDVKCFSIVTTPASDWMQKLHDREPLILDPADAAMWLDLTAKPDAIKKLIKPYAGKLTEFACAAPRQDVAPKKAQGDLF
ncbi:MAG: hypothetical protein DCC64_03710 [Planctomycetota bacterium]|nr:MAG: hypothetical protein DCC64_03710 [Planctomycetota bacterium]